MRVKSLSTDNSRLVQRINQRSSRCQLNCSDISKLLRPAMLAHNGPDHVKLGALRGCGKFRQCFPVQQTGSRRLFPRFVCGLLKTRADTKRWCIGLPRPNNASLQRRGAEREQVSSIKGTTGWHGVHPSLARDAQHAIGRHRTGPDDDRSTRETSLLPIGRGPSGPEPVR